ncbi:MAG: endonuclease/exonuclease/phosphatase family protein [bacterium]
MNIQSDISVAAAHREKSNVVRFVTFNLRIDVECDQHNRWRYRLPGIIALIKQKEYDVLCVQEPSPAMVADLLAALPNYRFVGLPRDARGEATPILYNAATIKLLDTETIWLSTTPERESTLPGSHFPRIATFARLETANGKVFEVVNTHLDYAGPDVRSKQAAVLLDHLGARLTKNQIPTVVAGDFNAPPEEALHQTFAAFPLKSIYGEAVPQATFHGFDPTIPGVTIDYVYCGQGMRAASWMVVASPSSSVPLSDHDPVEVILTF